MFKVIKMLEYLSSQKRRIEEEIDKGRFNYSCNFYFSSRNLTEFQIFNI